MTTSLQLLHLVAEHSSVNIYLIQLLSHSRDDDHVHIHYHHIPCLQREDMEAIVLYQTCYFHGHYEAVTVNGITRFSLVHPLICLRTDSIKTTVVETTSTIHINRMKRVSAIKQESKVISVAEISVSRH